MQYINPIKKLDIPFRRLKPSLTRKSSRANNFEQNWYQKPLIVTILGTEIPTKNISFPIQLC